MNSQVNSINSTIFLLAFLLLLGGTALGQQQVQVIDYCANVQTYTIPDITDLDGDGMDDGLESLLIQRYAPAISQESSDSCPSGAPGTGAPDGLPNLVPCRVYYIQSQWVPWGSGPVLNPVLSEPYIGSTWFTERVIMNCAVLYGKDCGTKGHLADVEPFYIRLSQIGHPAGARFDTNLNNWVGGWIETIAHQGTTCEKREDGPYQITTGAFSYDSLFSAADKHGNYLTAQRCGSGAICGDRCLGGDPKSTLFFNVGELSAPFVTDLGQFRSDYAGENPLGNTPFLARYGSAGAGTIKSKLISVGSVVHSQGSTFPLTCFELCNWMRECRPCGANTNTAYEQCLITCDFTGNTSWNCY